MNILELDSYNLADAVKFNSDLNPRIWQGQQMRPEVREKLLAIAEDFKEFLGIEDLEVQDITVSGSNANYSYTPYSDIDLHLVVDLPEADRSEVYRELFDAKKYQYNDQHNYKIGGYDVELYVENANKPPVSKGVYSVLTDDWINIPRKIRSTVDDDAVRSKYEDIKHRIEDAVKSNSEESITRLAEKIKMMRQAGLDTHGELGPENLAYKMLRKQGYIQQLYDARNAAKDQELSLRERLRRKPGSVFTYGFKHEESVEPEPVSEAEATVPTDEEILKDFISFCVKDLKLEHMPTVKLRRDPQWSVIHKTFGRYTNDQHLLEVAWGSRHIMDVLRTVAHELTHTHQHEREDVPGDAGETGSPYENEANARAGVLMRDYGRLHPELFDAGETELEESASGYIPTKRQAKDPRFSMALTQDIRPGQLGKEANKLRLKTNKQGYPQVAKANGLFEELALQLEAFKRGEELDEVKMSPTALKKFADSPAAKDILVGFEAEMIFPNVRVEDYDPELEPDYEADERAYSLDQVVEFFQYDEWGYGLSDREADRLREKLDEAYYEWYDEQMLRDFGEEAEDYIRKVMVDDGDWDEDNEIQKQLYLLDLPDDKINDIINAGERAPKFTSSKEQQEYAEANPDYKTYLDAQEEAQDLLDTLIQDEVGKQGANWDAALDDFRDNYQLDDDSGFFSDLGWRWMSDIANQFNLTWPYITDVNSGEGEMDIESVAESLSDAIDMPVVASYSYHGAKRKPGEFIVEPDGSLSPDSSEDGGLEIISPPMPIAQAMEKLNQVIEWAQARGCYTNSSTGLHMGVSLPGQKSFAEAEGDDIESSPATEKPIDFMKLALFLGDQYVLKEFGRQANSYAASTLKKLKERRWSPQQIATAMEKMRGNLINLAYKDLADRSPGRDSINMKDNYVEFRGAGGDYLSRESDEGMDFLENTLLRYVQALAIAGDPTAYRDEYAKKLYKLISPEGDDTLNLFSKFATGEIDQEKLKTEWARKTLEKDDPSAVNKGNWVVVDNNTGKTVQGQEYNGYTEQEVREKAKAKISPGGSDQDFDQAYSVHPKETGKWEIYRDDHGKDETLEIIAADRRGEAVDKAYDTYSGVIPFKVRAYYGDEDAKPEPTRRASLAKKIIQRPKQSKDYNYEIVNLGDVNLGVVEKFYATNKQDADATFDKWLQMKGLPNDTSNYGYRPRKQESAVQDVEPNVAQNFNTPPDATEQTGTWQLVDVTLNQPVETFQGTWAQAARIADQYAIGPGERNGHEISVRRA